MYKYILFLTLCNCALIGQTNPDTDTVAYSVDLDDYVITAQYEPTHYTKAIHKIDIIKRETLAKIGAVTLDQAVILSPAVRLYQDPILGTSITMRGVSSSNVAILVDGIPMIGRNNGAIDLSQISLQNIERIEIVEGPLSNIYGNNAAGGVINLISKKTQINEWRFNQENQLESIGQQNHTVGVGYQKGKINVGAHGRYYKYDQYPSDSLRLIDRDTLDDSSVRSTTRYPFNPKLQHSYGSYLRYNINDDNHLIAKYDLNTESVDDYGVIKRPQFNPYATDQFYTTTRQDASLSYLGKINDTYHVNLSAALNSFDRIRDDKRYYIETMEFDSILQNSDSTSFDQIFFRGSFNYSGWEDWTVGGGVNYTQESGQGDRLIDRGNLDSLITQFSESAVYSDIKYNGIKNLSLGIGNRFTLHSTYDNAFTTSVQAKYDVNPKLSLRMSYAEGYRSPALKELYLEFKDQNHDIIGNIDLLPERSNDLQSTITYIPTPSVEFSLNTYYTSIRDRITLAEYETLKFQYSNVSQYDVFGFQPTIAYNTARLAFNSSLSIGYWSTNIDRDDSPQYGRILDLTNMINYNFKKTNVDLTLNHRYVGDQPIYRIQNEQLEVGSLEGYNLVDLSLSKLFWSNRINVISGIRNLANIRNTEVLNGAGGTHSGGGRNIVSIGRSYFVSLGFNFQ